MRNKHVPSYFSIHKKGLSGGWTALMLHLIERNDQRLILVVVADQPQSRLYMSINVDIAITKTERRMKIISFFKILYDFI